MTCSLIILICIIYIGYLYRIRTRNALRVSEGILTTKYTIMCHFHTKSCLCMEGSKEQDLDALFPSCHKQNRGKYTPNHCRLPSKELEYIPNECTLLSTPTHEYFLQGSSILHLLDLGELTWGTSFLPDYIQQQWVFWWRLEYHSRRFVVLLLEEFRRYQLQDKYFYRT